MDVSDFFDSQRFKTYVMTVVADLDDSIEIIEENKEALVDIKEFMLDDATDIEQEFMQPFVIERLLNLITIGAYVSNFEYLLGACGRGKVH